MYIVLSSLIAVKSFRQQKSLKIHQWMHSGECPYVCEVCNKAFGLKCLMVTHLHMNSVECACNGLLFYAVIEQDSLI